LCAIVTQTIVYQQHKKTKGIKKVTKIARAIFVICITDMAMGFTDASYKRGGWDEGFCG